MKESIKYGLNVQNVEGFTEVRVMQLKFKKEEKKNMRMRYCQNCGIVEVAVGDSNCIYCGYKFPDTDRMKSASNWIVLYKKEKVW